MINVTPTETLHNYFLKYSLIWEDALVCSKFVREVIKVGCQREVPSAMG